MLWTWVGVWGMKKSKCVCVCGGGVCVQVHLYIVYVQRLELPVTNCTHCEYFSFSPWVSYCKVLGLE